METLLMWGIRLTFVLLCINAMFVSAQVAGIYSKAGMPQLETDVQTVVTDLNAQLTGITVTSQDTAPESDISKEDAVNVGGLIWDSIFGYTVLIDQIFGGAMSWATLAINIPLMFLQAVIMTWWGLETWNKIKPF